MSFTATRTTKQPALRSMQFIEKLVGAQSTNGSTKTSESVWRVAELVIASHRLLQNEQSATGANDGDTSLRSAHKGRTWRMPKKVHQRNQDRMSDLLGNPKTKKTLDDMWSKRIHHYGQVNTPVMQASSKSS
ncbi:hypothetical protein MRX96_055547 [Rhipicephalus microplus]